MNSTLVILNEKGGELWKYDTGIENLRNELHYKNHFQYKKDSEEEIFRYLPQIVINDINSDGQKEVLFSIQTQNSLNAGELFCFNHKGNQEWRFVGGNELKFGSKSYSPEYLTKGIEIHDIDKDGLKEIMVVSDHFPDFPTQLVNFVRPQFEFAICI
ncbi:MAG: VCBS repeat-containing protein [Candidatus Aminicenantes bacterium]|nr:VCBS repeat-containing protein [Candidatus Aminicenantes bacterium]